MSTIILRLEPPFVFDTPKGKADIHFMADYGYEADTLWGGFLRDSRQFWWFSNKEVLIEQNITIGRIKEKSKIVDSVGVDVPNSDSWRLQNGKPKI